MVSLGVSNFPRHDCQGSKTDMTLSGPLFRPYLPGEPEKNQKEFCLELAEGEGGSGCSIFMWIKKSTKKGWHELCYHSNTFDLYQKEKKKQNIQIKN